MKGCNCLGQLAALENTMVYEELQILLRDELTSALGLNR